jgi:hypothetical protein
MAGVRCLGTVWELPLLGSDGFKFWLDQTLEYSAIHTHAAFMWLFLSHIVVVQLLVCDGGSLRRALTLGFPVKLSGVVAALFTLTLLAKHLTPSFCDDGSVSRAIAFAS